MDIKTTRNSLMTHEPIRTCSYPAISGKFCLAIDGCQVYTSFICPTCVDLLLMNRQVVPSMASNRKDWTYIDNWRTYFVASLLVIICLINQLSPGNCFTSQKLPTWALYPHRSAHAVFLVPKQTHAVCGTVPMSALWGGRQRRLLLSDIVSTDCVCCVTQQAQAVSSVPHNRHTLCVQCETKSTAKRPRSSTSNFSRLDRTKPP